jgi:hypothetical protein
MTGSGPGRPEVAPQHDKTAYLEELLLEMGMVPFLGLQVPVTHSCSKGLARGFQQVLQATRV